MLSAHASRIALYLALLCLAVAPASAMQLGETREQLVARHGAPGAEDHARNVAAYFWEGWSAQIEFQKNVISKLTYRRNWYLQDTELTSLLESNGGAAHWKETSTPDATTRQWTRNDGASANCLRVHPLSMVFQTAAFATANQPEPKVVVPATPNPLPTYTKEPSFPKLLGTAPEPELPTADPTPAALQPAPAASKSAPADGALPQLSATDVATTSIALEPKPEAATETKPAIEKKPVAEIPAPAPALASKSHALPYVLGSLGLLVVFAGGGIYFLRRQGQPTKSPLEKIVATNELRSTAIPLVGLENLRSDQVELLVGEIYRRAGCTVELSAALNTDDGIDLMLRHEGETTLVQCKHWKAARVTSREVREFYGAMAAGGAPRGILVTTGSFSPDAREFAEGQGIELLDSAALSAKIAEVARPGENLCDVSAWRDEFLAHARVFDPECPVCQGTMVIRHNRANGTPTWGCRSYPRCPGRREPRLDLLPSAMAH